MKTLELIVDRRWQKPDYTISNLYANGKKICNVLEDTDRGLTQDMKLSDLQAKKKYGITAIPSGRYEVVLTKSPHFGRVTPELKDVPAYTAIRIHAGNSTKDTDGCLLPGENKATGKVLNSRKWEDQITAMIKQYDKTYITIL